MHVRLPGRSERDACVLWSSLLPAFELSRVRLSREGNRIDVRRNQSRLAGPDVRPGPCCCDASIIAEAAVASLGASGVGASITCQPGPCRTLICTPHVERLLVIRIQCRWSNTGGAQVRQRCLADLHCTHSVHRSLHCWTPPFPRSTPLAISLGRSLHSCPVALFSLRLHSSCCGRRRVPLLASFCAPCLSPPLSLSLSRSLSLSLSLPFPLSVSLPLRLPLPLRVFLPRVPVV